MKKLVIFVLVIGLLFSLAACSKPAEQGENADHAPVVEDSNGDKEEQDDEPVMEVETGLFDVEITLPATLFADEDIDDVIEEAKENGVAEVIKNPDGSLTYKMSKVQYDAMIEEVKAEFVNSLDDYKGETYPSIKDITYNDDLTAFTLVVDKEAYESGFDSFVTMGIGLSGMVFQMYTGVDEADIKVTMEIKDETSGEVFQTVVYPDDFGG